MPRKKNKNVNQDKKVNEFKKNAQEKRKEIKQKNIEKQKKKDDKIQKEIDDSWWKRKREQQVVGLSPVEESPEKTPEELNEMLKTLNVQDRKRFVDRYKKDYKTLRKMKNPPSNKGNLTRRINSIKPAILASMKHRLNPHSTSIGTIHDDGTFKFVENPTSGKSKKKRKKKKTQNKKTQNKKRQKKKKKQQNTS